MAPDNKFLWCPSGLHLLPTASYVRPQGGTNTVVSYVIAMEVLNNGYGVISYNYHDVASYIAKQAMCEDA